MCQDFKIKWSVHTQVIIPSPNEDEINSPVEKEKCQLFDEVVEQRLGEAAQSSDFGEGYETPTYEPYTDDDGDGISHSADADD